MTTGTKSVWLPVALACVLAGAALRAQAQGHPGGGGPGGPGGGGMGGMGGGLNRPGMPGSPDNFPRNPAGGERPYGRRGDRGVGGGLQLAPAGRWWDDSEFARSLGIDTKQQHRMDEVFSSNREMLLKLYKNLQHEEKELGKSIRSKELDEDQIFQHIDRVTQARGELEKANAHMLLQIRKEMSPEQTAKLDETRPEVQ